MRKPHPASALGSTAMDEHALMPLQSVIPVVGSSPQLMPVALAVLASSEVEADDEVSVFAMSVPRSWMQPAPTSVKGAKVVTNKARKREPWTMGRQ